MFLWKHERTCFGTELNRVFWFPSQKKKNAMKHPCKRQRFSREI